jgi:hypothetical protein
MEIAKEAKVALGTAVTVTGALGSVAGCMESIKLCHFGDARDQTHHCGACAPE